LELKEPLLQDCAMFFDAAELVDGFRRLWSVGDPQTSVTLVDLVKDQQMLTSLIFFDCEMSVAKQNEFYSIEESISTSADHRCSSSKY